jgi:hypothetical protein
VKIIGRGLIARSYRRFKTWLEAIEEADTAQQGARITRGLYHFPSFLIRLMEEMARAERYQHKLGLVVFHLQPSTGTKGQRRSLETALRDCLRKADIPGRLSEDILAVILPETGPGVPAAADRIARLLTNVAGYPVTSGFARYPEDAVKLADLLRIATERSSEASPLLPESGEVTRDAADRGSSPSGDVHAEDEP